MAKVTTLDIVKHDGEVYVKEARKAVEGDLVIITAIIDNDMRDMTVGKVYQVIDEVLDYEDFADIYDDLGDKASAMQSGYNVLVPLKPGAKVTVKGVEYEVSDLAPGIADLIVIIDRYGEDEPYKNGDVFRVEFDDDGDTCVVISKDDEPYYVSDDEYLTLIPTVKSTVNNETNEFNPKEGDDMTDVIVHEGVKYRKVEREVQEGDKHIVCTTDAFPFITKDKTYAIENIDEDGDPTIVDDEGDESFLGREEYAVLEPIPVSIDEQIAEAERKLAELKAAKAEQERLKVGDYVVIVDTLDRRGEKRHNGIIAGEVRLVMHDDEDSFPYIAEKLDGSDYDYFREGALRRATPEEVAEAKRKLAEEQAKKAEEAKWSAIGRKVGEYRAGDVVQIREYEYGNIVGHIGEIVEVQERSLQVKGEWRNKMCTFSASDKSVNLIVPVEQRFDKGA
jgi:ribosomal protein L21E